MTKHILTQAELKSFAHYDPETGVFTRTRRTANCTHIGDIIGTPHSDGGSCTYVVAKLRFKFYKMHRLAWLYMTGDWPKNQIDHIDGGKANNRFSNLREATHAQNKSNTPVQQNNTSGYKGVSHKNRKSPWVARIMFAGKSVWLGSFQTKELAYAAYCEAADKHHGEYAHY